MSILENGLIGENPELIRLNVSLQQLQNDIFTVPSGKQAVIASSRITSGASIQLQVNQAGSGVYRTVLPAPATGSGTLPPCGFVFEGGDVISLAHSSTASPVNYSIALIVFDEEIDGSGLKTLTVDDLALGQNTIYTCPLGSQAIFPCLGGLTTTPQFAVWGGATSCFVFNGSGANRDYGLHIVPNVGGVPGVPSAANLFTTLTGIATGTRGGFTPGGALDSLDSVSIATDSGTAGQFAWLTVYEMPAA